jgi:sugar/nucleoside kinase (ribokinase family)
VTAELLVAGSIALDRLEGPFGMVDEELGGSALYFALAASLITPVKMLAPVGRDAVEALHRAVGSRPIDTSLVDVLDAPTYRWRAQHHAGRNIDLGSRDSIYDVWEPKPPAQHAGWAFVGSVRPDRQAQLVLGLRGASMLAADAMLSYIRAQQPAARDVLRGSRWYFCNHEELAALGGDMGGDEFRRAWRLEGLVVKAGAGGVTAYTDGATFHVPALPHHPVVDTTGAGDAMAAGMLAHWLLTGGTPDTLHESLMWGVACASIAIEDLGVRALVAATREKLQERVTEMQRLAAENPQAI